MSNVFIFGLAISKALCICRSALKAARGSLKGRGVWMPFAVRDVDKDTVIGRSKGSMEG